MGFANQLGESDSSKSQAGQLLALSSSNASHVVKTDVALAVPQLDEWLEQLLHGDFQTRWEISKTLKQHPLGVLGPLLALLPQAQADEELLWFIARLLGEIDHPEAVDTLVNIFQSATTSEMQSVAALALANRGSAALPALGQLLLQPEMRLAVVQVLSQIDSAEVVDLLLQVVSDGDAAVRAAALDSLGGFSDPRIASVLLKALKDCDSEVRQVSLRAVGARAAHLPGVALDAAIAPLLHDFHPKVVEQAIVALGRLDSPLAHQALSQVLVGDQWQLNLQRQASRALGWSQSMEAAELLLQQLERSLTLAMAGGTNALCLAREIVVVLGRLRAAEPSAFAAQALESHLPAIFAQEDGDLKRSTALALGQLGRSSSFDHLCNYLDDPSPGLTFHIVAALRRLDPEHGLRRLQALLDAMPAVATTEGMRAAIAEWS